MERSTKPYWISSEAFGLHFNYSQHSLIQLKQKDFRKGRHDRFRMACDCLFVNANAFTIRYSADFEYTFKEIGEEFGISTCRAEQIYHAAMRKIQKILQGNEYEKNMV